MKYNYNMLTEILKATALISYVTPIHPLIELQLPTKSIINLQYWTRKLLRISIVYIVLKRKYVIC
jgi:hypothetical protein